MSPSSTFNSNPAAKRWPAGLLVAAAILIVVELAVARQDWLWSFVETSASGVMDVVEQRIIANAPAPSIIIMGSSRARDGVLPRALEQRLELPKGSVLNLGVTAGTPFDALTLYRRNRDKLRGARVLVFAIEDWHLNRNFSPNARDRRFATIKERVGTFNWDDTLSLLVGYFWRTYDAQEPLWDAIRTTVRGRKPHLRISADGRMVWRRKELEEGPMRIATGHWLNEFYGEFQLGAGRMRSLDALINLARGDGLQVLVIRLPWRDQYVKKLLARYASAFEQTSMVTRQIAGARVLLYERASAIGIRDQWFYDYGHLTAKGAAVMTDVLARELRTELSGSASVR